MASSVSEWMPPDPTTASGLLFAVVTSASLALLAWRRREVRLGDALVFAGTFYLAATAVRGAFFWAMVLPVVVGPHLAAVLPARASEEETRVTSVVNGALIALALAAALAVQPGVLRAPLLELVDSGQVRREGEGRFILNHEHAFELVGQVVRDDRDHVLAGADVFIAADNTPVVRSVRSRLTGVLQIVSGPVFLCHALTRFGVGIPAFAVMDFPVCRVVHCRFRWTFRHSGLH